MAKTMVLVGDYWHSRESIAPLMELLFSSAEDYVLTTDPEDFMKEEYDMLLSWKDPIENDQIPTPVWCTPAWTDRLLQRIGEGMGFLALHAAVTDLPADHRIVTQLYEAMFLTHPAQCPVTFEPAAEHPVTAGVGRFTFPEPDEHYVMELLAGAKSQVLAYTVSENGRQPALWAHTYGRGRVCMFTPGHDTGNLTCPEYVRLLQNMMQWCATLPEG